MVGSVILKTKIVEMVLNLVMILVTGEWRSWCQEQGTTLFAGSSADKVFNKLSKKLCSYGYCQISSLRSNWAGTLWHVLADFNKFVKLHLLTVHKFFSKLGRGVILDQKKYCRFLNVFLVFWNTGDCEFEVIFKAFSMAVEGIASGAAGVLGLLGKRSRSIVIKIIMSVGQFIGSGQRDYLTFHIQGIPST